MLLNLLHMCKDEIIEDILDLYDKIDKCNLDYEDKDMIKTHLDMYISLIKKEPIEDDHI